MDDPAIPGYEMVPFVAWDTETQAEDELAVPLLEDQERRFLFPEVASTDAPNLDAQRLEDRSYPGHRSVFFRRKKR